MVTLTSVISPTAADWHQVLVWGPSSSCLELCGVLRVGPPASALVPGLHSDCTWGRVQLCAAPKHALDWTVGGGWMTQSRCLLPADSDPPHQYLSAELYICSQSHWLLPEITVSFILFNVTNEISALETLSVYAAQLQCQWKYTSLAASLTIQSITPYLHHFTSEIQFTMGTYKKEVIFAK
jgi:hypothetical protein